MSSLRRLLPLTALSSLAVGCGAAIKGELPSDSADPASIDTAEASGIDSGSETDSADPSEPPRGDVTVDYTISWRMGGTTVELCADSLAFEDVDTSYRSWTLWTDANVELDLDDLPASAPTSAPVGDGTTVGPGSYRFVVESETDADLPTYASLVAGGAVPVCFAASGTNLSLRSARVPDPIPELVGPIDAVEQRLTVIWTDR